MINEKTLKNWAADPASIPITPMKGKDIAGRVTEPPCLMEKASLMHAHNQGTLTAVSFSFWMQDRPCWCDLSVACLAINTNDLILGRDPSKWRKLDRLIPKLLDCRRSATPEEAVAIFAGHREWVQSYIASETDRRPLFLNGTVFRPVVTENLRAADLTGPLASNARALLTLEDFIDAHLKILAEIG